MRGANIMSDHNLWKQEYDEGFSARQRYEVNVSVPLCTLPMNFDVSIDYSFWKQYTEGVPTSVTEVIEMQKPQRKGPII